METSASSQRYEELLQQIVQLNADLHKTATLSQSLQRERDGLQQNNRTLKEEAQRLHERCNKLQQVLMQETEHKIQSDRKHQDLIAKWKRQLEAKAKAFEALQKKFAPPKDLEQLRITIQEELEEPHRQRLEALQNELEKQRQMAFRYRHELEMLKTEHDQFTIDQGNEIESFHAAYEIKLKELQKKLEEAEQKIGQLKNSARGRDSAYEKESVESQIKLLHEEIRQLRAERTAITDRTTAAATASEKRLTEQMARCATLELDNKSLQRQVAKHKDEMDALFSRVTQAESKNKELVDQNEKLRDQLRQKDDLVLESHNSFAARLQEHRFKWEQEQITLREKLEEMKQRLGEKNARDEVTSFHAVSKLSAADLSSLLQTKSEELDRLRSQVEKQLDVKEKEVLQLQHQHETEITRLREQIDSTQRQCECLEQEKAQWMAKQSSSAEMVARVKADCVSLRSKIKEVENEYRTLQNKHRDLIQSQEELQLDNQQKEAKLSYLEQDIMGFHEKLQRDKDNYEFQSLELQRRIKSMEESFCHQKQALKKELRTALTKALRELDKTQKKRDAYKKKCLEAHEHLKSLAEELERKSAALTRLKHDHTMETQQLLNKLNEIENEKTLMIQQQFRHHDKAMEMTQLRPAEVVK